MFKQIQPWDTLCLRYTKQLQTNSDHCGKHSVLIYFVYLLACVKGEQGVRFSGLAAMTPSSNAGGRGSNHRRLIPDALRSGLALELFGLVSVKQPVWPATSISAWQHNQFLQQISSWDTCLLLRRWATCEQKNNHSVKHSVPGCCAFPCAYVQEELGARRGDAG